MKKIEDFILPCITDTEAVALKKRCIKEILKSNYKENISSFKNFQNVSKTILLKVTFLNLVKSLSYLELKKERIKNYILYIENQASLSTETEKQQLRIKWKACNRWLKAIESTENFRIPPPIELLKD